MKTIKEPKKNIALLWRGPKPFQIVYRPMKFLIKAKTEDGTLLYNIVTSEMVLLNENEERVFENVPAIYNTEMDELISRHYLVPEEYDENKFVRELRELIKKINPIKRVNGFTILPTTDCNARCYYCFESDHKHCTMTEEIVSDVVDYIDKKCKGEPIEIGWFGGEPLVAHKRITQICAGLREKNIKFNSSMISNAFLFDQKIIQTAKDEWNLTSVQITLDGTEESYNKAKAYVNPKENPYQRVINNIENLLSNIIAVNVRLNVTNTNIIDLYRLIDELEARFGDKKGFSAYSHAVYEDVGFSPLSYDDSMRELINAKTIELNTVLQQKGLLGGMARLPSLRVANCMADNDSCRLIYPDGVVGRCENQSSLEGIGDIYQDIINTEKDELYKHSEQLRECDNCSLYPFCINLKICPETGRCSKINREWKIKTYSALMINKYQKYILGNSSQTNLDNDEEVDQRGCES